MDISLLLYYKKNPNQSISTIDKGEKWLTSNLICIYYRQ